MTTTKTNVTMKAMVMTKTTAPRVRFSALLAMVGAPVLLAMGGGAARAQVPESGDAVMPAVPPPAAVRAAPAADDAGDAAHPNPRLKVCYRSFSIGGLGLSPVPLSGLEVDLFPLSTRWLRGGITAAAGSGRGTVSTDSVTLRYGLLGLVAGIQYPARITPFVEGQLSGGALAGTADGPINVPGTPVAIAGASGATWLIGRGVDAGAELYTVGRLYLSASVGWLRTTWRGPDVAATARAPSAGIQLTELTTDSFTVRLGVGF